MTHAYDNISEVLAVLEKQDDVYITGVEHEHDYSEGDSMAAFKLTVEVPVYEPPTADDLSDT